MPSGEFYTFQEVLKQLNIDGQKLKRLVSEGEIRAFREGDEMKFKRSDIDSLDVADAEEGETREINLDEAAGEASETLTDDLIFDEGDELDLSSDDAGMATAEITSQDTFVDEGGEPVGMSTEPLEFGGEDFEGDLDEEIEEVGTGPVVRRGSARGPARYQAAETGGDLGWCVLLILSLVIMIFGGFTVWSAASDRGVNSISKLPVQWFAKDEYKVIEPTLKALEGK